jgi:hypothetical protein
MSMSIAESVDQFCTYFERQLEIISHIEVDRSAIPGFAVEDYQVRFYRKALLIAGLDTLAGIRFPKANYSQLNRSNRERFIRFVKEFADWPHGNFVSLPFLKDQLTRYGLGTTQLGTHVSRKVADSNVEAGGYLSISKIDEPLDKLLTLAGTEREEEAIADQQHHSLLYRYRNYLLHEWREPGSSMEVGSPQTEPYYHGIVGDPRWHLVYPMQLFMKLFANCISRFKQYLIDKSIDPYSFVDDTSRW